MRLLHRPGIIMNVKKIRRLMRKFNLKCPIRKANPYRRMAKAIATSHVAPNVVDRRFHQSPRRILLTDITYLFFDGGRCKCYLSTVLDAFTHEVLAYKVSMNLKVDFVLQTVENLVAAYGSTLSVHPKSRRSSSVHSSIGSVTTSAHMSIRPKPPPCEVPE